MSEKTWWYVGIGSVAALGLSSIFRSRPNVETRPHLANEFGIVEADPEGLAALAGVPLDVYALASSMTSEEKTDRGRLAVGRAIWNVVKQDRKRLVKKLLPHGYFASQDSGQYAATSKPPTQRTLGLAIAIIEGRVPDFVEKAVQWDAPAAQDRNHQKYLKDPKKYPHYRFSSADIAKRRIAGGAREVRVPGVTETRFWSYA
jgi:hypothetical protein